MTTVDKNIITIENMNFSFDGKNPVLRDVNLRVREKESACIVGPNGGGKTTLFRLILGLLKPDSGKISVFDTSPEQARKRTGYVPQHTFFDRMFPVSVMDVVLMGRVEKHFWGPYRKEDRNAVMEALEKVDIAELARRSFSELSGGQRQRVLIARALVSDPDLILLDEPTANVDPAVEEHILDILNKLAGSRCVLVVSHDLGFVSSIFEEVICVNRQVAVHPTAEISGSSIEEIYGCELRAVKHSETREGHK